MPQKTQNLGLEVFDFDTDSSPAFINGVAGLTDSNMHKIDKAITEMVKVNNEGVSLNLITSPSGEELVKINDYTFSTDTINLRTPSSDNAEERYRELLKATSQEFQSDGSDIVVENGIEHQVLVGAKLEGQTVKNLLCLEKDSDLKFKTLNVNFLEDEYIRLEAGGSASGTYFTVKKESLQVECNKTYTLVFFTRNLTIDPSQFNSIRTNNSPTSYFNEFYTIGIKQEGITKLKFTTKSDFTDVDCAFSFSLRVEIQSGDIEMKVVVLEGDWTNTELPFSEPIPFGLTSTKAMIENNGNKYSFYNPIIKGKTYLMKAPKGTQEWVIDDISEERNFDKYDYKLDSPNGLHRAYNFYDKVDLQKREITTCTHFVNLDDIIDNDYVSVNLYPKEKTSIFTIKTNIPMDKSLYNNGFHYMRSNVYDMELPHILSLNLDKECCSMACHNDFVLIYLRVNIENTGKTKEGFKNYYRGKGIHFVVATNIPITRKMTNEEYEHYSKLKEPLELNSMAKYNDKLEIKEDKVILTPNVAVYDNFSLYYSSSKVKESIYIYNIAFYPYDFPNNDKILCNKLKTIAFNQNSMPDEEFIMYNGYGIYLGISKSKLKDSSAITVRDYMLQNGFKIMIPYKDEVKEDLIIEEIPTIATYETNKFSFGEEIKPSKATVDVSVNKIRDLEERVAQLKGVMTSISNLSLLGNYVEDEYNKEINQL